MLRTAGAAARCTCTDPGRRADACPSPGPGPPDTSIGAPRPAGRRDAAVRLGPPDAPGIGVATTEPPETSGAAGDASARCTCRNGATGRGRADGDGDVGVQGAGFAARSSPVIGRAVSLSDAADVEPAKEGRLLDVAASRTPVREDVAVNEGFCHVPSRMPNAESATPDPPSRTAR